MLQLLMPFGEEEKPGDFHSPPLSLLTFLSNLFLVSMGLRSFFFRFCFSLGMA